MKFSKEGQTLLLSGNLDRYSLNRHSLSQLPKFEDKVVVCLKDVSATDTAGLAFLLKLVSDMDKAGINISIKNAPKQLIALASVSNVLGLIPINNNPE